jgi:hypothetical protein
LNDTKELALVQREPAQEGLKVFNRDIGECDTRKLDEDVINNRGMVPSPLSNTFTPIDVCSLTSEKNSLPEVSNRLDTSLLDAFKKNPLTQSLHSYA